MSLDLLAFLREKTIDELNMKAEFAAFDIVSRFQNPEKINAQPEADDSEVNSPTSNVSNNSIEGCYTAYLSLLLDGCNSKRHVLPAPRFALAKRNVLWIVYACGATHALTLHHHVCG